MIELGVRILFVGPEGGGIAPPPLKSIGEGVEEVPSLCATSALWFLECASAGAAVIEALLELGPDPLPPPLEYPLPFAIGVAVLGEA